MTRPLLVLLLALPARADIVLIGVGTIPGDASDKSGLTEKLPDGTPHNRLGGLGSGIAHTGRGNRYVLVADRGPKDGAVEFACRVHWLDIMVKPGETPAVTLELADTTLLTDEDGKRFVGAEAAFDPKQPEKSLRLDAEGIRVGPAGTLFVSDEYGPFVLEFDAKGKKLRSLPVPTKFRPAHPAARPKDEAPPKNTAGRQPNRGFEGLAINPGGDRLYALPQSPLIQDTVPGKDGRRAGVSCRLLEIDTGTGKTREFVYPMEHPGLGMNEILGVGKEQLLVLERDHLAGKMARVKKLFLIDLAGATDVSDQDALPPDKLPEGVKAAGKKMFLDLLDPKFGIAGPGCPEKFEGMSFGPDLPDGRRLLLVTTDNDFLPDVPTRVYAFAIDRADLPGFEEQRFERGK